MGSHGAFELAVSNVILEELIDVLQRKFMMSSEHALENRHFIESFTRKISPKRQIEEVTEDPNDDRILECAVENVSDFIISRDKDLLRRKSFEGIPIIQVEPFLERGFGIQARGKR